MKRCRDAGAIHRWMIVDAIHVVEMAQAQNISSGKNTFTQPIRYTSA